jgi:CMP-N,N'-diacetyllegionaminic acid synthase
VERESKGLSGIEPGRATVLGLIPARGGSRTIPNKNIYLLHGKPLICYTIEVARASRYVTVVATSTDSAEIARLAEKAGSQIIARPPELSENDTPMLPVVQHAVEVIEQEQQKEFDAVVLLQPTSPLRTVQDIDAALEILFSGDIDSVMSVYALPKKYHPQRLKRIVDGLVQPYEANTVIGVQRQQLSDIYKGNGAIYAMWRSTLMEKNSLFGEQTAPYLMPVERSLDIDDWMDMKLAYVLIDEASRGE